MNFDESFFEDIADEKKEKRKQCPYSVRRQESCWFLSDNSNTDNLRVIEQLKYKADYLYAQKKYSEALTCFEQLSPLIPALNTVLIQEVHESRVISLIKMNLTEEAEKVLKEMIVSNKMNNSLWYLMFTIQKDKENLEEASFAIQQCLEENEEVASYWLDLAETYGLRSTCFNWSSKCTTCQNPTERSLSKYEAVEIGSTETAKAGCGSEVKQFGTCNLRGKDSLKQFLTNKATNNEAVDRLLNIEMTLSCSIKESSNAELDTTECEGFNVEHDYEELKTYARSHHHCYCALCSLLISRFLLHKYSSRSPLPKQERKYEDALKVQITEAIRDDPCKIFVENNLELIELSSINKVNFMIRNVTCATDKLINAARKVLYNKFTIKLKSPRPANGMNKMAKNIQEFDHRWFTLT